MSTSSVSIRIPRPPITQVPALLVREGLLTDDQVAHALAMSRGTSTTWIEHLLLTGLLDDTVLAKMIGAHASVPPCVLQRLVAADPEVLASIPAEIAVEHRAIPVWIEPDGDVCVAMVDPTDERAITELGFFTGKRVLRECARATGVAWALHAHYGVDTALWNGTDHHDATRELRRVFGGSASRPMAGPRR
jgi:hypothetical protein